MVGGDEKGCCYGAACDGPEVPKDQHLLEIQDNKIQEVGKKKALALPSRLEWSQCGRWDLDQGGFGDFRDC